MNIEDKYLEEKSRYVFEIPGLKDQSNINCCYTCRFSDFGGHSTNGVCFHPVIMDMVEGEHEVKPLTICPKYRR